MEFTIDSFIYSPTEDPLEESSDKKEDQEKTEITSSDKSPVEQTDYPMKNVEGEANLNDKGSLKLDISSVEICGLDGAGEINFTKNTKVTSLYFGNTEKLDFMSTLPCLGFDQSIIEGNFTLDAEVAGKSPDWHKGKLILNSSGGIIRRMGLLSKIFSVINFTEFLTFRDMPNLDTDGLPYNDLIVKSHIEDNFLIIDQATLKGKGLNITSQGKLNIKDSTADLTVFVAPFKMIDSVVTSIPLVGRIIGGKKGAILTFPVKVEGPIDNPEVTPLSPTAIGKATLDFITDTLSLPFAIFTPLLPDEKSEEIIMDYSSDNATIHE